MFKKKYVSLKLQSELTIDVAKTFHGGFEGKRYMNNVVFV